MIHRKVYLSLNKVYLLYLTPWTLVFHCAARIVQALPLETSKGSADLYCRINSTT